MVNRKPLRKRLSGGGGEAAPPSPAAPMPLLQIAEMLDSIVKRLEKLETDMQAVKIETGVADEEWQLSEEDGAIIRHFIKREFKKTLTDVLKDNPDLLKGIENEAESKPKEATGG